MRIAIFENIMTPGGNEIEFDRILVEELKNLGHEVFFYVPENFQFQMDYGVSVIKILGNSVSYTNTSGVTKIFASIKREINRQRWYSQLHYLQRQFDALIIPSATYRYLRALVHNDLKKISVPVIFILHGITPEEAPKVIRQSEKFLPYESVKIVAMTLTESMFEKRPKNILIAPPPTYIARDLTDEEKLSKPIDDKLTVGFFGQYRREKKLRELLEVFVNQTYNREVKLIVQGSTMHNEDAEDFEEIIKQYKNYTNLEFMHKGLIGADWQRAIQKVDAIFMPYSAPRYRYHTSAMLFTAIGFEKPVVTDNTINPEVFEKYKIGETFESGNLDDLKIVLKNFIDNFDENISEYKKNLQAANENFSPANFAKRLEKIILSN